MGAGDGVITPVVMEMFRDHDLDGDGFISPKEFDAMLRRLGVHPDK